MEEPEEALRDAHKRDSGAYEGEPSVVVGSRNPSSGSGTRGSSGTTSPRPARSRGGLPRDHPVCMSKGRLPIADKRQIEDLSKIQRSYGSTPSYGSGRQDPVAARCRSYDQRRRTSPIHVSVNHRLLSRSGSVRTISPCCRDRNGGRDGPANAPGTVRHPKLIQSITNSNSARRRAPNRSPNSTSAQPDFGGPLRVLPTSRARGRGPAPPPRADSQGQ